MSLTALSEILIHIHTYKNIDLLNQGIYKIKVRICTLIDNQKFYAVPYFNTESKALESLYQLEEQVNKSPFISNASIDKNGLEYSTKSFYIKYADEEVELDEFVYFRVELPYGMVKNESVILNCEFELLFSDVKVPKNAKEKNEFGKKVEFKSIQTESVMLSNEYSQIEIEKKKKGEKKISGFSSLNFSPYQSPDNFLESFSPIVYHGFFSSVLKISIHKSLLDFRIRLSNFFSFPFLVSETEKIENEKTNIDLSTYPSGIYLLRICDNGRIIKAVKIIKN